MPRRCLPVLAGLFLLAAVTLAKDKPYGLDKYTPVTTSTVIGSPEPPPPFRVERLFPKLKMDFPICVRPQPGTDLMLTIDQPQSYGPTHIGRIRDHADNAEIETLLKLE